MSPSVVKSTRSNPSSSSNPNQEANVPSAQETSVQETSVQETTVQPAQDDNVQMTEVHINDVVQPTEPGSNVHALTDVQNSIVQTSSVATCTSQQTNPDVQDSTVQAPMPDSVHTSSVSVQNGDVQALTSVQESSVGELSNCTEVHDYILPDVQLQLEQVFSSARGQDIFSLVLDFTCQLKYYVHKYFDLFIDLSCQLIIFSVTLYH